MLAIFHDAIVHGPEAILSPRSAKCSASKLAANFNEKYEDMVILQFEGKAWPILFDSNLPYTELLMTFSSVFEGALEYLRGFGEFADMFGKVRMFWGRTSDGFVAFVDDEDLIWQACRNSSAIFPQGCYFSSDDGLRSCEHPLQEVNAVFQVVSQGQTYSSTFKVDMQRSLTQ
ncbi:hypothetical protein L7F22_021321 [Adiantum nelumboides]|nr:hypothetical protein [Adiantum nelumboides]